MRQAEGNEKDLKKLMSLFDEVMSRVAEFNSKADELGFLDFTPEIGKETENQLVLDSFETTDEEGVSWFTGLNH